MARAPLVGARRQRPLPHGLDLILGSLPEPTCGYDPAMPSLAETESYLHEHIPISRALGVTVVRADAGGVELRAPLAANINHRSTVFGGSAISVAILAAWTLVHLWTMDLGRLGRYRVVIRRSEMDYRAPIQGDFSATCTPPPDVLGRFTRSLERHRTAGVDLTARVSSGDIEAGSFAGSYVAIRLDGAEPY